MTDVVDRSYSNTAEADEASTHADARRVLTILIVFALVALLANFWL